MISVSITVVVLNFKNREYAISISILSKNNPDLRSDPRSSLHRTGDTFWKHFRLKIPYIHVTYKYPLMASDN